MKFDAKETAERLRSGDYCCGVWRVLKAFGCLPGGCKDMSCSECRIDLPHVLADALDPRDTQESIDEDVRKPIGDYWGCYGKACDECPATIDGKTPYQRYGLGEFNCHAAKTLDLLRRQREIDGRAG